MSNIILQLAGLNNASEIHAMQIRAFKPLLEKYRDEETSPANEPLERVEERIAQPAADYYLIRSGGQTVGAIRIVKGANFVCRISPLFVLPEYQGRGIAQQALTLVEQLYGEAVRWELDTILQERGSCHLYEKLGYRQTGRQEIVNERMTLVFYYKEVTHDR